MLYPMIDKSFKPLHPQRQLEKDGMKEIKSEVASIADCWFFEVEKIADPLPPWYQLSDWKFS